MKETLVIKYLVLFYKKKPTKQTKKTHFIFSSQFSYATFVLQKVLILLFYLEKFWKLKYEGFPLTSVFQIFLLRWPKTFKQLVFAPEDADRNSRCRDTNCINKALTLKAGLVGWSVSKFFELYSTGLWAFLFKLFVWKKER